MNTIARSRLSYSILIAIALGAFVNSAQAADSTVTYGYPSADTSGVSAQLAPGFGGCTIGCASLYMAAKAAVPARRQGRVWFSAPAGTTIVSGTITMRYRTKDAGVFVHLQTQIAGRWVDSRRLHSSAGTSGVFRVGGGGSAVAVALVSDLAVVATSVKGSTENSIAIAGVTLLVRDLSAPTAAWSNGDPGTGLWQRRLLCGEFSAQDVGLGVDHVDYVVGNLVATAVAPRGSRLQPRSATFSGSICVDTTQLEDGVYGTALSAVDTGVDGNRSNSATGVVRVDNTSPVVEFLPPADTEARLPTLQFQLNDRASGIASSSFALDGVPLILKVTGPLAAGAPAHALTDGQHRVTWTVTDAAGNATSDGATIGVIDITPPLVDSIAPVGLTTNRATVTAHITDSGSGVSIDTIRLAVDGIEVTALSDVVGTDVRYEPAQPWTEGEHTVRLTATDRSGNRTVRTWAFQLPITPPAGPVPPTDPPATHTTPDATDLTQGLSSNVSTFAGAALELQAPDTVSTHGRRTILRVLALRGAEPALHQRLQVSWVNGRRMVDVYTDARGGADIILAPQDHGTLLLSADSTALSVVVRTGAKITLTTQARAVRPGGQVLLTGGIVGLRSQNVRIEARVGLTWHLVTTLSSQSGRFSTPVRLQRAGHYVVRARVGSLTSQPLRLVAD